MKFKVANRVEVMGGFYEGLGGEVRDVKIENYRPVYQVRVCIKFSGIEEVRDIWIEENYLEIN